MFGEKNNPFQGEKRTLKKGIYTYVDGNILSTTQRRGLGDERHSQVTSKKDPLVCDDYRWSGILVNKSEGSEYLEDCEF